MDNYTLILDFIDYKIHWNSFCPRMVGMAFKRSAVRSRLYPPKVLKTIGFQHFFIFFRTFQGIFRPLELRSNMKHSRGVVMARISIRNVQKSTVEEYFSLYLSSAAARGVKDKTLQTYKNHFRSIAKRMDVTVPMNRLNSQDLEDMILRKWLIPSTIDDPWSWVNKRSRVISFCAYAPKGAIFSCIIFLKKLLKSIFNSLMLSLSKHKGR